MTTAIAPVTEEEFFARYGPKDRVELVDGEVVPKYGADGPLSPTSNAHGRIVVKLVLRLGVYVERHALGEIYTDPACFIISEQPKRIRCPDVAFLSSARAPAVIHPGEFLRLAPDLAAEVISPSEPRAYTDRKIQHYLDAGVRLVWRIDMRRRDVTAYAPDGTTTHLAESDTLDGGDVVPGFAISVAELFAGVAAD
ncbi:hypothetical protein tb265_09730 [Gemmatimonadetes bacterium T265]|nr:hypothetical protein tb265_09730 [Gemmatimonadetes bacterium T265]